MIRGERGFVATEFAVGVALLVVPVALLVGSLPGWFDRQSTARLAAREAARAATLVGWCDATSARQVVEAVAVDAHLPESALELDLDCEPGSPLERDAEVTARVTVRMPALAVPMIGAVTAWDWTAAHVEPVDPYGSRP